MPNSKIFRALMAITLVIHLGASISTIYYIVCGYMTKQEVLNYLPVVLVMIYPLVSLIVTLYSPNTVGNLKNEFYMWSLEAADSKIYRNVKQTATILNVYAAVNLILCLTGGFLFLLELPKDADIFFAFKIINDAFPNQKKVLAIVYRASLLIVGYSLVAQGFQTLYYTQHMRFQYDILQSYIANISSIETFEADNTLFYNEAYQREIKRRLVFCIRRYDDFIQLISYKVAAVNHLFVIFSLCGCILGIGIILYFFSGNFTYDYYMRMSVTCLAAASIFSATIWSGQSVENTVENMIQVSHQVKWYNFNKDNKTVYLIFAIHLMRHRQVKFSENYSINYELGLAIVRGIYSVISVVVNFV